MVAPVLVAKVLTVSDSVDAGDREDRSGPALIARLVDAGFAVIDHRTCQDGIEVVSAALREMAVGFRGLVVTTGGTGFGPRDLTPEATRLVIDRDAPGFAEAIRAAGNAGTRDLGILSRAVCGTVGAALVCNLPGSSVGAVESLEAVLSAVPHALELLAGEQPH